MWNKGNVVASFLGKATAERAVPTRTIIDIMGVENVGGGTDFPTNVLNPFINIYVMLTRKDMNGAAYGKDQAIPRQEALRLHTTSAARYTLSENRTDSIEPGKLADLVVISAAIVEVEITRRCGDRLGRDRRSGSDMDVIELATRMSEAKCKRRGAARARRIEQAIVASVTIDLQNAVEPREQLRRALALAIFGEHIHHRRRRRAAPWPVIHGGHP